MTWISDLSSTSAEQALADVYQADWGRLLSLLVTRSRRLDLAEDSLSEAFARASETWPSAGVPAKPAAWLYTTAWRLIIGSLRAEAMRGRKAPLLAVAARWTDPPVGDELDDIADDRLSLILLCCHPALHPHARSPLALRLILGTSTAEIARLFLVPTSTMAARLTRAKKKIVVAGIPLAAPVDDELRLRLDDVCRTIYLAFTAGYAPGQGPDLLRTDIAGDAVRLAAILHQLLPHEPQVHGLYALLLLQHARRDARVTAGRLVTLPDQDRTKWQAAEIREGLALVKAVRLGGPYAQELRLQALIAAEHARAATAAETDWPAIAAFYQQLEELTRSPIVRMNRAVAVAQADGPRAGLELLTGLEALLPTNHRVYAVRAELARQANNIAVARASYAKALELCTNAVEHQHLTDRSATLD